jgi:hypothetical protein
MIRHAEAAGVLEVVSLRLALTSPAVHLRCLRLANGDLPELCGRGERPSG